MTKNERKERRLANKTKRQERKTLRKQKFSELMAIVNQAPDFPDDGSTPDYARNFMTYWPLAKAALEFAESSRITRPKMDLQIQRIIVMGDGMTGSPVSDPDSEYIMKFQKTWRIIRTVVIALTVFVKNEKTEDRVDKLIEIGDWISGLEGND